MFPLAVQEAAVIGMWRAPGESGSVETIAVVAYVVISHPYRHTDEVRVAILLWTMEDW
jgi:hypothetical protein